MRRVLRPGRPRWWCSSSRCRAALLGAALPVLLRAGAAAHRRPGQRRRVRPTRTCPRRSRVFPEPPAFGALLEQAGFAARRLRARSPPASPTSIAARGPRERPFGRRCRRPRRTSCRTRRRCSRPGRDALVRGGAPASEEARRAARRGAADDAVAPVGGRDGRAARGRGARGGAGRPRGRPLRGARARHPRAGPLLPAVPAEGLRRQGVARGVPAGARRAGRPPAGAAASARRRTSRPGACWRRRSRPRTRPSARASCSARTRPCAARRRTSQQRAELSTCWRRSRTASSACSTPSELMQEAADTIRRA